MVLIAELSLAHCIKTVVGGMVLGSATSLNLAVMGRMTGISGIAGSTIDSLLARSAGGKRPPSLFAISVCFV
jgi:hypothetical protein